MGTEPQDDDFGILVVDGGDGGDVIVAVRGEIDMATGPSLWERLDTTIPTVSERLVLDLGASTFIDSTGLAVLVRAIKELHSLGCHLVLRAPSAMARKTLAITGLDTIFTIEPG